MGRPKGRNYKQYKIYLTPYQIEWLQRLTHITSSALFRVLLTNYMELQLRNLFEEIDKESKKLEALNAELDETNNSWTNHNTPPPNTWQLERTIEKTETKLIRAKSEIKSLEKAIYG